MMPPTISTFNTIDIISLDQSGSIKDRLENLVASIRAHLDMDVSLITQFTPTVLISVQKCTRSLRDLRVEVHRPRSC